MRTAFIETLTDLAAHDSRIWLITGDVGFSVLESFAERFPDRYLNAGIAEQNMTGIAAGLALSGHIVFTYSIANFPTIRCLEQIRNDVCYHQANVKVVAVGGGYAYGPQGYTHHGVEDLGIMRMLPGMTVVAPGDPIEARLATQAIVQHQGPCYLRLDKGDNRVTERYLNGTDFQLGHALRVRFGHNVALLSTGGMLAMVLNAAEELADRGIEAEVLSVHTLKPIDADAINDVADRIGALVTIEEHSITGGLGSAVAEVLAERGKPCQFRRFGSPDAINTAVGSQDYHRRRFGDLVSTVTELLTYTGT